MEAREGNHVDRQLTQVSVQLTGEPAAYYSSKEIRGSAGLKNDVSTAELERELSGISQDKFNKDDI